MSQIQPKLSSCILFFFTYHCTLLKIVQVLGIHQWKPGKQETILLLVTRRWCPLPPPSLSPPVCSRLFRPLCLKQVRSWEGVLAPACFTPCPSSVTKDWQICPLPWLHLSLLMSFLYCLLSFSTVMGLPASIGSRHLGCCSSCNQTQLFFFFLLSLYFLVQSWYLIDCSVAGFAFKDFKRTFLSLPNWFGTHYVAYNLSQVHANLHTWHFSVLGLKMCGTLPSQRFMLLTCYLDSEPEDGTRHYPCYLSSVHHVLLPLFYCSFCYPHCYGAYPKVLFRFGIS